MKRKKLLTLFGSIFLALAFLALLLPACAAPAPAPTTALAPTVTVTAPAPTVTVTAPAPTVTVTAPAPAPEEEVYKWDMTYPLYRGTWDWDVLVRWVDDLRVASGGRIDITPYAGGEIIPAWTEFDAVSTGTIKIDFDYGPYLLGWLPMAIYASGIPPFTLTLREHYTVLYHELGLEDLLRQAFVEHNVYYVATIPSNNSVLLSQIPVTTAADFTDLNIRAVGIYGELAAAAGADVTAVPWGEIYGALDTGMINGAIAGPLSSQVDADFHVPNSYFLETPITPADSWTLLVNLDAWNELPGDLQMLIYESTSYAADIFTASYYAHDLTARETIVDMGYTITTLSAEEQAILATYTLAILDEYSAEDPVYFAQATAILKDYMRALGLLD